MTVDAVAYEEALARPTLIVRRGAISRFFVRLTNLLPGVHRDPKRKKYVGRLLSHPEFERHRKRFLELEPDDEEAARKALWDFCVDQQIPPDKVLALPGPVQEAVIADFFVSQARANGRPEASIPEAWEEKVRGLTGRGLEVAKAKEEAVAKAKKKRRTGRN